MYLFPISKSGTLLRHSLIASAARQSLEENELVILGGHLEKFYHKAVFQILKAERFSNVIESA